MKTDIKELTIPHAVKFERPDQFEARKARAGIGRNGTSKAFRKMYKGQDDIFAVVGSEAIGLHEKLKGVTKYVKGYMDVYLVGILAHLLPHGHDNIILGIGHPPNAINYTEQLKQSVGGSHRVQFTDGTQANYKINYAVTFDENGGGVVQALSRRESNFDGLRDGDFAVICDIGGQIGSIYLCQMQGKKPVILFDRGTTFEIGVDNVKDDLNQTLRSRYPDLFQWDIDDTILESILQNFGRAVIRNREYVFRDEFHQAVYPMINAIERYYTNDLRGALQAKAVYLTGGGSAVMGGILREDVFKHTCRLADDERRIHLANVSGGAQIVAQKIRHEYEQTPRFRKLWDKGAVCVVVDAGNTQGKAVLLS